MGKGEIALNEQFLLFPQCFKRLVLQTHENQGLFGKGFNEDMAFIVVPSNKIKNNFQHKKRKLNIPFCI